MGLNPVCQDLTLVSPPRWVGLDRMKPNARHGSITFAFIDEDGSRLRQMKQSPPCLFGSFVRPKLAVSKPLIKQCSRCWKLGHLVESCQRKADVVVCFICGAAHRGSEHQFKCPRTNRHDGLKCSCPVVCLNCKKTGHSAKDIRCPLRGKYRDPYTRTGDSSDEEERTITATTTVPGLTARLDAATASLAHRTSPSPAPEPSLPPSAGVRND